MAATSHRYRYFVNLPEIGVRWAQGWAFGADALTAAHNAIADLLRTNPRAAFVLPGDVYLTHCGACSCLPADQRRW